MGVVKNILPKLKDVTKTMRQYAEKTATGLTGEAETRLEEPNETGINTAGPDRFDLDAIMQEFDRAELEGQYRQIRESIPTGERGDPSTVEAMLVMRENEFLAAMERDYMMRKRSRIRGEAHAATRKRGHGLENYNPTDKMFMRILDVMLERSGS